ncbi:unnamed protein product [Heterobilharzia americana]|nr:unnamed protein product [Heterobilharzia americana]
MNYSTVSGSYTYFFNPLLSIDKPYSWDDNNVYREHDETSTYFKSLSDVKSKLKYVATNENCLTQPSISGDLQFLDLIQSKNDFRNPSNLLFNWQSIPNCHSTSAFMSNTQAVNPNYASSVGQQHLQSNQDVYNQVMNDSSMHDLNAHNWYDSTLRPISTTTEN